MWVLTLKEVKKLRNKNAQPKYVLVVQKGYKNCLNVDATASEVF